MDFNLTPEEEVFRDEVRAFLDENLPPEEERDGVFLLRWAPDTVYPEHVHTGGEEIFVLEGAFHDADGHYPQGSWVRYPHGSRHEPYTLAEGALLYVKEGHLPPR